MKCIFRTLALAAVLSLLLVIVPGTPTLAAPLLTLSPISGSVGAKVTVTGNNFSSYIGDSISILFNNVEIKDSPLTVPTTGSFSVDFNIPDDTQPGTAYVTVKGKYGSRLGVGASFTVWEPEIKLDTGEGIVGTTVMVEGRGFYAEKKVNFYYDGTGVKLGSQVATSRGECSYSFTIPEGTAGRHKIVAQNAQGHSAEDDFEVVPFITLTPASGAMGDRVTVSGTGFGYKEDVTITFDDDEVATSDTDKKGSFETGFNLPAIKSGIYEVKAEDKDDNIAKVDFTMAAAVSLNPTTGNIGTELAVSGTGFIVGGIVTIEYDGAEVATAMTDSRGAFLATFKTPPSEHGPHTVTVSDGTNTKQFTFAMESTPPPVPELLVPEDGGKAKAEAYFEWEEVEDPSGVTYTWQIATDKNFTDVSIVLEKEGLTYADYTLGEEEKLQSTKAEAPYYWRVKAIDGAANESEWSTSMSFYVGFSWALPSGVLIFLIVLGVLGLGFLAFWLGRRTAYF